MVIPEKPEFLYKYCSASRAAQIIKDLTFYFTPVSQLNDLFEFRVKSLFSETEDSKYRVFAKRMLAEGWWSTFEEAYDAAKSMSPEPIDETYSFFREQLNAVLNRLMVHTGVTCFSSERNNQRMWGTYGLNHTGACIEFSTSSKASKFASHLMPVIYTDSKLPLCPSEFATNEMELDQWMLGVFCCVKHLHWEGEKEWRLLLLTDQPQSTSDRVVPFERTSVARVFIGPRMSKDDEAAIRRAANLVSPPIPVYQRAIHEELAQEESVGVEKIHSFDQLKYWIDRTGKE